MTNILLAPARSGATLSTRQSRYLLEFAGEIAEDLPTALIVVRYGGRLGEQITLNAHRGEVELFG